MLLLCISLVLSASRGKWKWPRGGHKLPLPPSPTSYRISFGERSAVWDFIFISPSTVCVVCRCQPAAATAAVVVVVANDGNQLIYPFHSTLVQWFVVVATLFSIVVSLFAIPLFSIRLYFLTKRNFNNGRIPSIGRWGKKSKQRLSLEPNCATKPFTLLICVCFYQCVVNVHACVCVCVFSSCFRNSPWGPFWVSQFCQTNAALK